MLGHDYFQVRPRPGSGSSVTYIGRGTGSADGQMRSPMGIALDSAGTLYVSDYQNKRIQKFDLNDGYLATIQPNQGSFYPRDLAVDNARNKIYICAANDNRIIVANVF